MKPENPSASHPIHPPVQHQFEHEVPTVIHDPEADMTALGRWFHHAYQDPAKFWGWCALIVIGLLGGVTLSSYLSSTKSASSDLWSRLDEVKKPAEKVELVKEFPNSPAATWAILQAATEFYKEGIDDLPANRDAALPTLKKALDLFEQVSKEAPKDSPQARYAVLGKARTLEARNELPKAIEQYNQVTKDWPGTPEAKQAESLAKRLQSPAAVEFYKDLYAYTPPKATLPAMNSGSPLGDIPGLDLTSPIGGAGSAPALPSGAGSFPFLPPPPATTKPADMPTADTKVKAEAPAAKPADAPAPKVEAPAAKPADAPAPKVEAPAAKPADAPAPKVEAPAAKPADAPAAKPEAKPAADAKPKS